MSVITKTNKMKKLLCSVKEIQNDLVANDGKKFTEQQREKLVDIWNKLDDTFVVISALQSMLNKNA